MELNITNILEQLGAPAPRAVEAYIQRAGGVPTAPGANGGVPAGITVMQDTIPPVEFNIITDSEDDRAGRGFISEMNGNPHVTFFLPEGWSILEINHRKILDR